MRHILVKPLITFCLCSFLIGCANTQSISEVFEAPKDYGDNKTSVFIGTLARKEVFGPPNYGETPKTDQVLTYYVLDLPIMITVDFESIDNPEIKNQKSTSYLQLAGSFNAAELSKLVGQKVSIQGKLFPATSGHHITPILLDVEKIH